MDIEIATYWNVATLYYILNSVASIMSGAGFEGMMRYVFLLAFGVGIFAYAGSKQLELAKWFIQALIFVTLLNLPIARVIITDRTLLEPPRVVDNVPFTLAVVAQASNLITGWMTDTYETVLSVPDELGLQQGDLGFGHRILKSVNKATIRDPGLRADIMQFFKECTLRDIDDGVITPLEIVSGTDTWNVIFNNTSPARFVTYDTLTGSPITDTCFNTAEILSGRVEAATIAAQTFYGRQAFTRADSAALATEMYISAIGSSYDWVLDNASTASEALRQSMFNNLWREAGTELPALLGDTARIAEVNAMTASAQAAVQAAGANTSISILAQETLPHMRNWIEAILFAMFPVVVVLVVLTTSEGAKKILGGYMMSLAWIGIWPVLYAVVNHLSLMHLSYKANTLELATGSGIPFQLSDVFDATITNEQAMLGWMVILVPFLSAAIIKMGSGGIMTLADRMVAGFSSAVHGAGYQHSIGNHSMGHASMDNASGNHTSMNRYDTGYTLSSGGAAITSPNGDVWKYSPDGRFAVDQFRSNMIASRGIDTRTESNLSAESHRTDIAGEGNRLAYRNSETSQGSQTIGHNSENGAYQRHGETATDGLTGSYNTESASGESLQTNYNTSSTWDERSEGRDIANIGVRTPWGGGGRSPSSSGERRLINTMQAGGASASEIDSAVKNYRSQSGGSKGGARSPLSGGVDAQKSYSATHGSHDQFSQQHGTDERTYERWSSQETGSHTDERSLGNESRQYNRLTNDATYSDVDDRTLEADSVYRNEYGTGDRSSHSQSHTYTAHYDAYADPNVLEAVAQRNGMSAPRLYSLPTSTREGLVDDYLSEMETVRASRTMQTNSFSGNQLPSSSGSLRDLSSSSQSSLSGQYDDIQDIHGSKASGTGAGSTAPMNVDTSTPPLAYQAKSYAEADRESFTERTEDFDSAVHHNTSPDRPVGGGRRSELGSAHKIAVEDAKDGASSVVNKVKGWFGNK